MELIDGETAGAPYLPRANDTYRLVGPNGRPRANTARMEEWGSLVSMRRSRAEVGQTATAWPAITENGGWEEMAGREITWSYGKKYWETMAKGMKKPEKTHAQKAATERAEQARAAAAEQIIPAEPAAASNARH